MLNAIIRILQKVVGRATDKISPTFKKGAAMSHVYMPADNHRPGGSPQENSEMKQL